MVSAALSWRSIPGDWVEPDLDLLRQSVSRDLLADVGRISRRITDQVLDEGLQVPVRALGSWLMLSNAVRGWLVIGYQAERWLTEPIDGVVLADEIRDHGTGAAALVLQRLVDALPWDFEPANLYRQSPLVPQRWDLVEEPDLLEVLPVTIWQQLLRHAWASDEVIAAAIDAPVDRVIELREEKQSPSEVETVHLQILAAVCFEFFDRGGGPDVDGWLRRPLSSGGSIAENLVAWDDDSIRILRTHLPPRP